MLALDNFDQKKIIINFIAIFIFLFQFYEIYYLLPFGKITIFL